MDRLTIPSSIRREHDEIAAFTTLFIYAVPKMSVCLTALSLLFYALNAEEKYCRREILSFKGNWCQGNSSVMRRNVARSDNEIRIEIKFCGCSVSGITDSQRSKQTITIVYAL